MTADSQTVEDLYTKIAIENKLVTRFQVRKAVEELRTVVRESPSLARAHFELGSLLAELGDYEGALERYVEARRLGVEQAEALGAEDWLLDADQQAEFLDRLLREQSDAK